MEAMTRSYLDAAREGKNDGWRYLVGLIVFPSIFVIGLAIALTLGLLLLGVRDLEELRSPGLKQYMESWPTWVAYTLFAITNLSILAGLVIAIEKLHQRSLHSVVDPHAPFCFRRLLTAFGLWFALACGNVLLNYLLYPNRFTVTFDPSQWFFNLPFVTIAILTGVTTSEIARGYALQGLGLITRQPVLLVILSALLASFRGFDVQRPYLSLGEYILNAGLAAFILKSHTLELALGIQIARGAVSMVAQIKLPDSAGSSLALPSVFTANLDGYDFSAIASLAVRLAIFYAVFFRTQAPTSSKNAQE
ncbi:MAG TPA: hypothetical protein V6C84_05945 [Coleofasciculaceae cyanobacterium]|jgi:hypothetical protein